MGEIPNDFIKYCLVVRWGSNEQLIVDKVEGGKGIEIILFFEIYSIWQQCLNNL